MAFEGVRRTVSRENHADESRAAPRRYHQDVAGQIFYKVKQYLYKTSCKVYIAPFDVRLPKSGTTADQNIFTVVQPDVCIICDRSKLDIQGCIGAPDTIFEVVSQGNVTRDLRDKFALYEEHGVPEYWVVLPHEKTIAVFLLDEEGRYLLRQEYSEPVPIPVQSLSGLSLLWEDVFEEQD